MTQKTEDGVTDKTIADEIRSQVCELSRLMNLAKSRGLTVSFGINEVKVGDDVKFIETVDIKKVIPL